MAANVKSTTSLNNRFQLNPDSMWVIVLLATLMSFVSISIDLLTPTLPILTKTFDASANNIKLVYSCIFFRVWDSTPVLGQPVRQIRQTENFINGNPIVLPGHIRLHILEPFGPADPVSTDTRYWRSNGGNTCAGNNT